MNIMNFIIVFTMTWWIVFFISLPFGYRVDNDKMPGNDEGAPEKTYLLPKAIITSIITIALTLVYFYVLEKGLIGQLLS